MTPLETAVREELERLRSSIESGITDPAQKLAIAQMSADLAMIPARLARGENVDELVASLKAEALNRSLELRTRAEVAATRAWVNVVQRLVVGVVTGALS